MSVVQNLALHPNFVSALRGIWLFTWRPQLASRKLPMLLLGLLLLPALVYLTIPSPGAWAQRRGSPINPGPLTDQLARRLNRAGHPLRPEQRTQFLQLFSEESSRLRDSPAQLQTGDPGAKARREVLKAGWDRIESRGRALLDEPQLDTFKSFKQRELGFGQNQIRPFWGRVEPFYHWLIDLYFFVILPLQCVRASGGLIRDELQADTLGFLITRPISRARLLLLKYVAQTCWLELALLLQTLLFFATGALRQLPELGSLLPLFLAVQILAVPAWSGLGIFLGQITKRYMPLALLYGLIVEMGIGRIPTNINSLSLIHHLKSLLARNAGLQSIYDWPTRGVPMGIGALLLAAVAFIALAAVLFTTREYHHTAEMQK